MQLGSHLCDRDLILDTQQHFPSEPQPYFQMVDYKKWCDQQLSNRSLFGGLFYLTCCIITENLLISYLPPKSTQNILCKTSQVTNVIPNCGDDLHILATAPFQNALNPSSAYIFLVASSKPLYVVWPSLATTYSKAK